MEQSESGVYLLTGAGFTKNFGGLLAREMWEPILNHSAVQERESLRQRLLWAEEFDFEGLYDDVVRRGEEEDRLVLERAISEAYCQLDEQIRPSEDAFGSSGPYRFWEFLRSFGPQEGRPGKIFTLNQDLLLERHYSSSAGQPSMTVPGLRNHCGWFQQSGFTRSLEELIRLGKVTLVPDEGAVEAMKKEELDPRAILYFKLHGSCNWRSGASETMVLGRGKKGAIDREPLLRWYFECFREALTGNNGSRLLITGYGFSDAHVNDVLATAIQEHGLRIYMLNPTPLEQTRLQIEQKPNGRALLEGLAGYYPYTFSGLLSWATWRRLHVDLFGREPKDPNSGPF